MITKEKCQYAFMQLDIDTQKWLIAIATELKRAMEKHPWWPDDLVQRTAIVGEESGELLRASLQYVFENGQYEDMHKEAIHTAATCLRFLICTPEIPV